MLRQKSKEKNKMEMDYFFAVFRMYPDIRGKSDIQW